MNKTKRIVFVMIAVVLLMGSSLTVLAGSNYTSAQFPGLNAYGTEFVVFYEGTGVAPDILSYTVSLIGTERDYCTLPFTVGTSKHVVATGTLGVQNGFEASETNKLVGYGNTYGYVSMTIEGISTPIEITASGD